MNERIRELAKQADPDFGNEHYDMPDAIVGMIAIEKFAELIVRECADISFEHWEQFKDCSAHFAIREHFGVKR